MSKLLISEHPLQVIPSLAVKIGLNEAIFLQQLHYWIENPKMGRELDGRKYIRNSFEEWEENFPFWSLATIKRTVKKLKADGLIVSTGRLNTMQIDRTQWYTIDYDVLVGLDGDKAMTTRKCQNDTLGHSEEPESVNVTLPECQSDTTNNQRLHAETTTTTTTAAEIFKIYKSEIGAVSPIISDDIKSFMAEIETELGNIPGGDETALDWFRYAIAEAVHANVRRWSFVRAILENILDAGSLATHKLNRETAKNGQARTDHREPKTTGKAGSVQKWQRPPATVEQLVKQRAKTAGEILGDF